MIDETVRKMWLPALVMLSMTVGCQTGAPAGDELSEQSGSSAKNSADPATSDSESAAKDSEPTFRTLPHPADILGSNLPRLLVESGDPTEGLPCRIESDASVMALTYDEHGWRKRVEMTSAIPAPELSQVFVYEHDAAGELHRLRVETLDGETKTVIAIQAAQPDKAGLVPRRFYDWGADDEVNFEIRYEYDAQKRLVSAGRFQNAEDTEPTMVTLYTYGEAGNLMGVETRLNGNAPPGGPVTFEYDERGRLISAVSGTEYTTKIGGREVRSKPSTYKYVYDCAE